ncbi:hypothetical protein, partial [Clostridium perfringens]
AGTRAAAGGRGARGRPGNAASTIRRPTQGLTTPAQRLTTTRRTLPRRVARIGDAGTGAVDAPHPGTSHRVRTDRLRIHGA